MPFLESPVVRARRLEDFGPWGEEEFVTFVEEIDAEAVLE